MSAIKKMVQLNVLIVDDDANDVFYVQELLESSTSFAIDTHTAGTLAEGLKILGENEIDVLFLDLILPDSKDLTSIEGIRERFDEVPIVILSGMDDIKNSISAMDMGAEFYLVKNHITLAILEKVIRFALQSKQKYLSAKLDNQIRGLMEQNEDPQVVLDRHYQPAYLNQSANQLFPHPTEILKKLDPENGFHDNRKQIEFTIDFEIRYFEVNRTFIEWAGQPAVLYSFRDITYYINTQEKLSQAYDNIQVLIRELQHRVINSFTILVSILNLLKDSHREDTEQQLLDEIESKIRSMMILYQHVYNNNEVTHISFIEYFNKLMAAYFYLDIETTIDCPDSMMLMTKHALSLGLIIVEMITNSMKHGFTDIRSGKIFIRLSTEDRKFCITYRDNGKGFNADEVAGKTTSFGFALMEQLIAGMSGEISILGDDGFTASMNIPLELRP